MTQEERDELLIRLDERMSHLISKDGSEGTVPEICSHLKKLNGSVEEVTKKSDKTASKVSIMWKISVAIFTAIIIYLVNLTITHVTGV